MASSWSLLRCGLPVRAFRWWCIARYRLANGQSPLGIRSDTWHPMPAIRAANTYERRRDFSSRRRGKISLAGEVLSCEPALLHGISVRSLRPWLRIATVGPGGLYSYTATLIAAAQEPREEVVDLLLAADARA